MIQTFAGADSVDIYTGLDTRAARRAPPKPLWSIARRKLHWIDSA